MELKAYKKDNTGKIREWKIVVNGNTYYTETGIVDGKIIRSEITVCEGKNIGRSNETTPEQQAELEAQSLYKRKLEHGYYKNIEDVDKGVQYIEPMLAQKYKSFDKVQNVFTQPKLDGIRCIASRDGVFSRKGKEFVSIPHILKETQAFLKKYPFIVALDGELYNHELKDDFNKITSLVKRQKVKSRDALDFLDTTRRLVQYHVYDIITVEPMTFSDRARLLALLDELQYTIPVATIKILTEKQLDDIYGDFLTAGYEGQMVRDGNGIYEHKRSKFLLKRKEFVDVECEILDVIEGKGNRSGMAGSVKLKHPNGNVFNASIRGGLDYNKKLLNEKFEIIGKLGTVRYQNLTPDGIPRFPVFISVRDYE